MKCRIGEWNTPKKNYLSTEPIKDNLPIFFGNCSAFLILPLALSLIKKLVCMKKTIPGSWKYPLVIILLVRQFSLASISVNHDSEDMDVDVQPVAMGCARLAGHCPGNNSSAGRFRTSKVFIRRGTFKVQI